MKRTCMAVLLSVLLLALGVTGCSNKKESVEINLACVETTQALVEQAVPLMEAKGYTMTYTMFDNNMNTLTATNDGSVDGVLVVHKPFMESFNKANGADLVMLEPYVYTVGMGLFSEKYDSIEAIPDGATIAIPSDSMNMDRALRILEGVGLIRLDPGVEQSSVIDVIDNARNLTFIDMDQTQTVRSLEDTDAAIAFFSHMKNAEKDFTTYLARDVDMSKYPTSLVVKAENEAAQWAVNLNEVFRSAEIRAFAEEYYGGLYEYFN